MDESSFDFRIPAREFREDSVPSGRCMSPAFMEAGDKRLWPRVWWTASPL